MRDSPGQAAVCHILGLYVCTFVADGAFGSSESKKPFCFFFTFSKKQPHLVTPKSLGTT
jgi:hypothetical protein